MIRALVLSCLVALAAAGAAAPAGAAEDARAHWTISTQSAKAQELFDRGLVMLYAFDTGEARVIFGQALASDPDLGFAYWGLAEADTIDINVRPTPESEVRGAAAAMKARAHLAHASAEERALVDGIAKRYTSGTHRDKLARYADALSAYTKMHRDEPNALVIAGYALYAANPALLDEKNAMTPKAHEILDDLDRALVLEPANVGAHHLRIHLLESVGRPKDAVSDAEALSAYHYALGESHLPHMAGHIWARTGEYERLIVDNQNAVENDRAWFAAGNGPGQESMRAYHDHDVDFVLYGLTTIGRNDDARAAAKDEAASLRTKVALRLHDDAAVLASPSAGTSFARAIAAARSGNLATARAQRAKIVGDDVHRALVDAALAQAAGNAADRVAAYARAYAATKSSFPGDPKDDWETPIGEGYGAALLAAGKPAEAETVFTAELTRFPNDPHLEWGLAEALKAEGKDDGAARAAYRTHWKGTRDLTLTDLG